ncbi:hypothetical protein [Priestia megaterium]|uniref:hypothetical protein n=1 Tax=Priestia megaterium TaxID=1404 RepID=UPI0028772C13|nr:hypothetical protein [Priestia megaterium]
MNMYINNDGSITFTSINNDSFTVSAKDIQIASCKVNKWLRDEGLKKMMLDEVNK